MLEKNIEQKLAQATRKRGGLCLKFVSPGYAGVPERLTILPGGHVAFIELKAPGQKPRPLQKHRHQQLRKLGMTVFIVDHPTQIESILDEIQAL